MSEEEIAEEQVHSPPPTFLFTLRVWQARSGKGQSEWRGRLQSVTTGEVRYFRDWQTFVVLIREILSRISLPDTGHGGPP
jgi:hypothetical protein